VAEVTRNLAASLEEMTLNELGSPPARDLLRTKVVEPLGHLQTDSLNRLRASLDTLAAAEQAELPARQTEASTQQKQVLAEMDAILKQMSQWESFVDVVNQLKQIIKLQTGVLESTEQERKKRTAELFDD
jgi:hypothetical protein